MSVRRLGVVLGVGFLVALVAFWLFGWVPRFPAGELQIVGPAEERVVLFAVGDTGTGDASARGVFAAMEARCRISRPHGVLLLGDNFYREGVASTTDPGWQSKFYSMIDGPCLSSLNYYPILGNHDYRGSAAAQIERSEVDPRWRMPHRYYAVAFGTTLQVTASDSEAPDFCFNARLCAVDFLRQALGSGDFSWRLTTGHRPMASSSARPGYERTWYGQAMKGFLCNRTDIYVSGHAHILERRLVPDCRVEQLIAGGGGGKLQPLLASGAPEVQFARAEHGFLEIVADRNEMAGAFIDTTGAVLHAWSRSRQ